MIPLRDENPVDSTPVLTWLIIGACLAVFFLWQPSPFDNTVDDTVFSVENAVIPCELMKGRPLRFAEVAATFQLDNATACGVGDPASPAAIPGKNVWLAALTSMFLHGGLFHIGGNMLFLWVFGNNIEDVMGKVGFAAFYLSGGILATLAHVVLNRDSTVPLVGASGAIAAVMGAYAVLFPHARVRTLVFALIIFVFNLRAVILLGAWFVLQFFTDPNSGVAWGAHVGGFVFGLLVGLLLRARGAVSRPPPPAPPAYRVAWR